MTPKERAAMQPSQQAVAAMRLALEALEKHQSILGLTNNKQDTEAITALREALAEPELNLNCKSVQKRLATVWGYVKAEQAEQEPVVVVHNTDTPSNWSIIKPGLPAGTQLYAAPVRTKDPCNPLQDLTDDEIAEACGWKFGQPMYEWVIGLARAVIEKFKEKNK